MRINLTKLSDRLYSDIFSITQCNDVTEVIVSNYICALKAAQNVKTDKDAINTGWLLKKSGDYLLRLVSNKTYYDSVSLIRDFISNLLYEYFESNIWDK